MTTIKDVNTLRLVGKDTGKIFKILADDDKVHLSSEFNKTLIDGLYIDHEGDEKHLSSHLTEMSINLNTETKRAQASELDIKTSLEKQLSDEETSRIAGDKELQTQITDNKNSSTVSLNATQSVLTAIINDETTRATQKEAELSELIEKEKLRAENVEATIASDLAAEVARSITSERIITSSILTEKNRALVAESNLQDLLNQEVSDRLTKDGQLDDKDAQLESAISSEIERATLAEQEEKNRAELAESNLLEQINTERTRAMSKELYIENTLNNVISNTDASVLDSLSEIVTKMNNVDENAYSRIFVIEEYIKKVFDLESLYPLTVADMTQIVFDIRTHSQVFPDEQAPSYSESGGWMYKNDVPGKINWYFAGQDSTQNKTLEDYSGFYARVKLESVESTPFFNLYTKAKGDGTDAGSWYGSRRTYVFPSESGVNNGDEVLMYIGNDLPQTYPDIPHIKLVISEGSSNGTDVDTQEFLTISFATDSAAVVNSVDLCAKSFIVGDGKHTHIELTSSPPPTSV